MSLRIFHKTLKKMVEIQDIDFLFKNAFAPQHHKDLNYETSYFNLEDLDLEIKSGS